MPSRRSDTPARGNRTPSWILPADTERSLAQYIDAIRAGRWIVLVTVLAAMAGAILYVVTAQKEYEAHSQLLVTPLPSSTSAIPGPGLVQQSADPLRDVETFASFVKTTTVAQRVKQQLATRKSTRTLLLNLKVTPIAQSDIVDVAATDSSPAGAQQLADAFATATVDDRTAALYSRLIPLIRNLKAQLAAPGAPAGAARTALESQLAQLQTLRAGPDPTIRVQALADRPTSPVRPRKTLTLVAGLFGGLVAGVGLVFLIQLLDPRLRREEELRGRFRLPVLARVPRGSRADRSGRRGPLAPDRLTPEATDAYRSLRSVLSSARARGQHGRVVLITGATPLDGKTTTAINLGASLAVSRERVLLIEGDIRRPSIGSALNISVSEGVESVLFEHFTLEEALVDTDVTTGEHAPNLRVLLANPNGAGAESLPPSEFREMLSAARSITDWVVIDAPPLIYAPDLLLASQVIDDVILVVRLGNTNLRHLAETAEMLEQHGIRPAGFVVVGTTGHATYY